MNRDPGSPTPVAVCRACRVTRLERRRTFGVDGDNSNSDVPPLQSRVAGARPAAVPRLEKALATMHRVVDRVCVDQVRPRTFDQTHGAHQAAFRVRRLSDWLAALRADTRLTAGPTSQYAGPLVGRSRAPARRDALLHQVDQRPWRIPEEAVGVELHHHALHVGRLEQAMRDAIEPRFMSAVVDEGPPFAMLANLANSLDPHLSDGRRDRA